MTLNLLTNPFAATLIVLCFVVTSLAVYILQTRRSRTPKLRGPARTNLFFGVLQDLFKSSDPASLYLAWEKLYGQVYEIPSTFGSSAIVLGDPKAIAHVLSNDTMMYNQPNGPMLRKTFGNMLVVMEGETHKRQRRALSPAFSISALRSLTDVFVNSYRKLQSAWDSKLERQADASGSVVVDIQSWMNCVSLDSIGNGGFSHDFGALTGQQSAIMTAFESFGSLQPTVLSMVSFLIGARFPSISIMIPNKRRDATRRLIKSMREIAGQLLEKVEKEHEKLGTDADKSIIGTLIKSEHASEKIRMSIDEIMAQNLMLIAGYETTSVTLTWALIELCRNLDIQDRLRVELRDNLKADQDPTYDQVHNSLPYLDAFTCEVLRLHSPQPDLLRKAVSNDMIPLTRPIVTASGALVENLPVFEGTFVRIPLAGVNRSEVFWGKDAGKFDPQRWLSGGGDKAQYGRDGEMKDAVQGYRHLLTFAFGPRMCLGRNFALTEFKVVLALLVRRYTFALPDGPETKLESHRSILLRPKLAGEDGPRVPLVIRRVEE